MGLKSHLHFVVGYMLKIAQPQQFNINTLPNTHKIIGMHESQIYIPRKADKQAVSKDMDQ